VRAERQENCAQLKREHRLHQETKTMTGMLAHLRSIVDHDGAVILDMKRDHFFSLNPVGSYIWERLLKGEDLDQISKALAEETGTEISVVVADVNDFIADLQSKQLFHFPQ
jgi:Coenzyme PQQ synthesis protein D (PqqD)